MGLNETGFPSPAQGYEAKNIDWNALLVKNKSATYYFQYAGSELLHLGIYPESKLIIDRSIKLKNDNLVVFAYEGHFHCRKCIMKGRTPVLVDSSGNELSLSEDVVVFGVVTNIIRSVQAV
jgi:DNA polymerase V